MKLYEGCAIPNFIGIKKIFTFFRTDFRKDYVFKGERHDFYEMVFVMDGNVGVTADSNVYVLEKGQVIVHKPNEFHKIWSEFDTNPNVIIISFSSPVFPDIKTKVMDMDAYQLKKIEELYDDSFSCFKRDGVKLSGIRDDKQFSVQEFKLRLELFIMSVIKRQTDGPLSALKSAELYSSVVRLMTDNPDAGYSIDDIAEKYSISAAYLKKIFKKYSGCGVIQYYNKMRIGLACGYLESGTSVKETAQLLGFNDQNYFSTFFKRFSGCSPSDYKKKNCKKS